MVQITQDKHAIEQFDDVIEALGRMHEILARMAPLVPPTQSRAGSLFVPDYEAWGRSDAFSRWESLGRELRIQRTLAGQWAPELKRLLIIHRGEHQHLEGVQGVDLEALHRETQDALQEHLEIVLQERREFVQRMEGEQP